MTPKMALNRLPSASFLRLNLYSICCRNSSTPFRSIDLEKMPSTNGFHHDTNGTAAKNGGHSSPKKARVEFSEQNGSSSTKNGTTIGRQGRFVVFEGLDKSGKSSQAKSLVDRLNEEGIKAALMKFPTREGDVGPLIDKYLRKEINLTDETIHLLFSADRWETQSKMTNLLQEGYTLIVDRYAYSGIAFSSAKGLDFEWCVNSDRGLLAPDRVLFLNVSSDVALQRQGYGDERYEKVEFQTKVRKQYQRLLELESKSGNEWKVINADESMEHVAEEIYREVLDVIEGSEKPRTKLFV